MKTDQITLSRGTLAGYSGVNIETIRYYEKKGLMPDPMRSAGGHRIYDQSHLRRLSFIRKTRELGFTIREIREFLDLVDSKNYTCAEIRDRTNIHLRDVEQKLRDLQKMRRTLTSMVSRCNGGLVPECIIIDSLFDA
jgi:MerR family mercuric resistance operon transcriptional regulator